LEISELLGNKFSYDSMPQLTLRHLVSAFNQGYGLGSNTLLRSKINVSIKTPWATLVLVRKMWQKRQNASVSSP